MRGFCQSSIELGRPEDTSQDALCVLGLPETATQEEIRTAYEKLEERYSEDHYLGSPLWDLAAEKRERIRAAYAELTEQGAPVQTDAEAEDQTETEPCDSVSRQIRTLLNRSELDAAQTLLEQQPNRENDPELLALSAGNAGVEAGLAG